MNLSQIKQEAREEFEKKARLTDNPIDQGPDAAPIDGSFYEIYRGDFERFLEETLDRLVDEIEKAVVPEFREGDWECECGRAYTYDEHNACVSNIEKAFTRFKGESV